MRVIGIILLSAYPVCADQDRWYIGMDNILFMAYTASVGWSHTDLPLECDQWFPGHLELHEGKCRPHRNIHIDPPENFHSNSLFPGLHVGHARNSLRLELEYFFREHHGYEGVAPFNRSGSFLDIFDYNETDPWLHGNSQEFYFSAERIAEVWTHCGFLNVYYDVRRTKSLVPYVGAGFGWAYQHVYYWGLVMRSNNREALKDLGEPADAAGTLTLDYDDLYDQHWAYQVAFGLDWKMRPGVKLGMKMVQMDIPGEFKDSASFLLLRSHGSHLNPGPRPEWEDPIQYTLRLYEWKTWRFALNLKAMF